MMLEAHMGDMLIRGIPDALKNEIAGAAKDRGQSLSAKAVDLLRRGLVAERDDRPERSAWDELRSAFEIDGPPTGEFAQIMDEIEAVRKKDFGRPVLFGADDEEE
jgi:plasmid stability protein